METNAEQISPDKKRNREEKVERNLERNPAKGRKEKKGFRPGNKREGAI